jgi:hypothetical protein
MHDEATGEPPRDSSPWEQSRPMAQEIRREIGREPVSAQARHLSLHGSNKALLLQGLSASALTKQPSISSRST